MRAGITALGLLPIEFPRFFGTSLYGDPRVEIRSSVFRHGYAVELDADQLGILRGEILAAAPAILREIDALDSFLARVAAAGSD
jgi:hypothetical protein